MIDCNWLQSLEVGIDPAHTSFLHRFFHDEDPTESYGKHVPRHLDRRRHADDARSCASFRARPSRSSRPSSACGIVTLRQISDAVSHVRVTNLMFPNAFIIPMSREMTITQWHVPIDDTRHYWYAIFTSFGAAGEQGRDAPPAARALRTARLRAAQEQDATTTASIRTSRSTTPITGMGADINVHDQWACELMGTIQDRTREHLGQSDKAISAYRRLLRQAIEDTRKRRQAADGARCADRRRTSPARPPSTASARPTTGRATGRRPTPTSARRRAGRNRAR